MKALEEADRERTATETAREVFEAGEAAFCGAWAGRRDLERNLNGSGPNANAALGMNVAPLAAGAGTVLSGSGFLAAHGQESVLDVGAHYGRAR